MDETPDSRGTGNEIRPLFQRQSATRQCKSALIPIGNIVQKQDGRYGPDNWWSVTTVPTERRKYRRNEMEETMPHLSRSPGYVLQRDAEDAAALAGELVEADTPEAADIAGLCAALHARPFTGVSLVKARRLADELLGLDTVENRRHLEERRIARRLAGETLALNTELFAAQKETPDPCTDRAPNQGTEHVNRTTSAGQLPLFGGAA